MTTVLIIACVSLFIALVIALRTVGELRTMVVVHIMADGAWWRGAHIVQASKELVPPSSIYVVLHRLEDAGLVESREDEVQPGYLAGIRRRVYRRKPS